MQSQTLQVLKEFDCKSILGYQNLFSQGKSHGIVEKSYEKNGSLGSILSLPAKQSYSIKESQEQASPKHKQQSFTCQKRQLSDGNRSLGIIQQFYQQLNPSSSQVIKVKKSEKCKEKITIFEVSNLQIKKSFCGKKQLLEFISKIAEMSILVEDFHCLTGEELYNFYEGAVDDQRKSQVYQLDHNYKAENAEEIQEKNAVEKVQKNEKALNDSMRDSDEKSRMTISSCFLIQQSQRRGQKEFNQFDIDQNQVMLNQSIGRWRSRSEGWRRLNEKGSLTLGSKKFNSQIKKG